MSCNHLKEDQDNKIWMRGVIDEKNKEIKRVEAKLADAVLKIEYLKEQVASPDCMGCAHMERSSEMIRDLEGKMAALAEVVKHNERLAHTIDKLRADIAESAKLRAGEGNDA